MFINILYICISDYNRPNYGKDKHKRACCYATCNCQSKLFRPHPPKEICKSLVLKTPVLQGHYLFWLGPPLPWGVLSVLSSVNLFLPQVRPQIFLCVLTKNRGPQGRVFFDSPYTVTLSSEANSEFWFWGKKIGCLKEDFVHYSDLQSSKQVGSVWYIFSTE